MNHVALRRGQISAGQKGPNVKKKGKNCEGKDLLKKGDKVAWWDGVAT
jgi:hypothetical protein